MFKVIHCVPSWDNLFVPDPCPPSLADFMPANQFSVGIDGTFFVADVVSPRHAGIIKIVSDSSFENAASLAEVIRTSGSDWLSRFVSSEGKDREAIQALRDLCLKMPRETLVSRPVDRRTSWNLIQVGLAGVLLVSTILFVLASSSRFKSAVVTAEADAKKSQAMLDDLERRLQVASSRLSHLFLVKDGKESGEISKLSAELDRILTPGGGGVQPGIFVQLQTRLSELQVKMTGAEKKIQTIDSAIEPLEKQMASLKDKFETLRPDAESMARFLSLVTPTSRWISITLLESSDLNVAPPSGASEMFLFILSARGSASGVPVEILFKGNLVKTVSLEPQIISLGKPRVGALGIRSRGLLEGYQFILAFSR